MAHSACHPSGVSKMSSNPLIMGSEGGDITADLRCLWPMVAASSLCVQAVSSGLSGLAALISDESAVEVCKV